MKIKHLALALTVFALGLAPHAARAESEVSFQFFYDTLSPLGEWVQVGDYGECWHPSNVDEDWSPYTDGYWSYTDAGWTWVSYEDWGGVCYHYGRWVRTDDVGWCWVPDYEWGPAWVSWRNNDTAVGWAPLPPAAHWRSSVGFSTWCDESYDIGPGCYNFCPVVDFGAPLLRVVLYPRVQNVTFISTTVNITNITYNSYNNVVFCGGPNFVFINQHSHRPVPALKLVTNLNVTNINHGGGAWTNARPLGNTLQVYAPKIVNNNTTIINKPKITKIVNQAQVNNGWNVVKDPGEKQKLRDHIKQQNNGLTAEKSPAKPIKTEDLKPLPEKADPKGPSTVAITNKPGKDKNGDDFDTTAGLDACITDMERHPHMASCGATARTMMFTCSASTANLALMDRWADERNFVFPTRESRRLMGQLYERFGEKEKALAWYRRADMPKSFLARVRSERPLYHTGRVEGRLMLNGKPLAGVQVGVVPHRLNGLPLDLERTVLAARSEILAFRPYGLFPRHCPRPYAFRWISASAITDADGRFALTNLTEGEYTLLTALPPSVQLSVPFDPLISVANAPPDIVVNYDQKSMTLGDIALKTGR